MRVAKLRKRLGNLVFHTVGKHFLHFGWVNLNMRQVCDRRQGIDVDEPN
jgi:hypothetical protein